MDILKVVAVTGLFALSAQYHVACAQEELRAAMQSMCASKSSIARNMMISRQNGVSMSSVMSIVEKIEADSPLDREEVRGMLISAYESPRYQTDSAQLRAVEDFENSIYLDCYKDVLGN